MIYKNDYKVYEDGNIFSYKSNSFLKPFKLGINYLGVSINRKPEYVHRIMAKTFLSDTNEGLQVNHKDGNKLNNHIENLEWVTRSENIKHSYDSLGRRGRTQNFWKGKKHKAETIEKMRLAKLK